MASKNSTCFAGCATFSAAFAENPITAALNTKPTAVIVRRLETRI
jgi:hypothetical protein